MEPLERSESGRSKPSIEEPPVLELKPLPSHLTNAFLGPNFALPVIIFATLTSLQEEQLLEVLRTHKSAIGWTLADIKRISPTFS